MKTYTFKINGNEYNVDIKGIENGIADVSVNGKSYSVEIGNTPAPAVQASAPAAAGPAAPSAAPAPAPAPAAAPKQTSSAAGTEVTAPLPGVIIEVSVKEGQAVKAGQKVAVLEAMKMENEIQATCDGTVTAILVNKGDSVAEGAGIVKIG